MAAKQWHETSTPTPLFCPTRSQLCNRWKTLYTHAPSCLSCPHDAKTTHDPTPTSLLLPLSKTCAMQNLSATCSSSCGRHTCGSPPTNGSNPIRAPCRGSCGASSHSRPSALWPVLPLLSRGGPCPAEAWGVRKGSPYSRGGHCTTC